MKTSNAALMFSIYNKYKVGKNFLKNINMNSNKKSLCKHKNICAKPVLGDVS
jgi:hypothetical protein